MANELITLPDGLRYPALTWSPSRHATLERCERRYYLHYYESYGGWRTDAVPARQLSYRLRHLTSIELVLGTAIHQRASELARQAATKRAFSSVEMLTRSTRRELNAAVLASRDRDAFTRHPASSVMLAEMYYGRGLSPSRVTRINERLERAVPALRAAPEWEALRSGEIRNTALGMVDTFAIDGVAIRSRPDLVLLQHERECQAPAVPAEIGGAVTISIVEWKTGSRQDTADSQVDFYAAGLGTMTTPSSDADASTPIRGRVYWLGEGITDERNITPSDVAEAVTQIRGSVARMRTLLSDPARNVPRPAGDFALTAHRAECRWCPFFQRCEPELRA